LVSLAPALWNLATALFLVAALVYGNRLRRAFKGSMMASVYALSFWAFVVLFVTFSASFVFDLMNFSPVAMYGVSVKDMGSLFSAVLFMGSLRAAAGFWLRRRDSSVWSKPKTADPVLTRSMRMMNSVEPDRDIPR
jgi:hypothetical protein